MEGNTQGRVTGAARGVSAGEVAQKSVPYQLDRQSNAIEALESRVDHLRDRLSAVLSTKPELKSVDPRGDQPRPSVGCDTANAINSKTCRIESVLMAIDDLLDRIEL